MIYGVGTHTTLAHSPFIRAAIKDLGLTSIRQELIWESVENGSGFFLTPGYLDRIAVMDSVGTDNVSILCYGNPEYGVGIPVTDEERLRFAEYCRFVLPIISRSSRYIEIWNEWNIGAGKSPAQVAAGTFVNSYENYIALCAVVSPIIRKLAPNSVILGGATAGHGKEWFRLACDAGLLQYVDAVSCHPYNHSDVATHKPEDAIQDLDGLQILLRQKNGGASVDVYITEIGWPTHTAGHDAARVAGYLSRFYRLCSLRPWIKGVWWYDLLDDGVDSTNREFRFGLLANDAKTPKPAYHAFKALMKRDRVDQYGWCRVAVTTALETQINSETLPERFNRGLCNLSSTGTTTVIGARTLNIMTGPVDLAALYAIGEHLGDDLVLIEGPVVRGQIPAQTTATRTDTWPNGWG